MIRLQEPEKWREAKLASTTGAGKAMGLVLEAFSAKRSGANPPLLGMLLCVSGVIGLWGVGFFSNALTGPAIEKALLAEKTQPRRRGARQTILERRQSHCAEHRRILWHGRVQQSGASLRSQTGLHGRIPRRSRRHGFFLPALSDPGRHLDELRHGLLPALALRRVRHLSAELFPTRLRSTGTSFCYNVGRFLAATGPLTLGKLQAHLGAKAVAALPATADAAAKADAQLGAFRNAACYLSTIFLVGLIALIFLPETKGRPLPED
jgi:hypothetical protein